MKIKTVRKIIRKKLTEWLNSIEDEDLRRDVRRNVVLSGGSIASLLLGEQVNDYDVYIMDINVCERLAKYYVKCEVFNGNRKNEYLKDIDDELFVDTEHGEDVSEYAVLVKTLHEGQIKLDVSGAGYNPKYKGKKKDEEKPYRVVFLSQNAISLSDDIQIVLRFTGTVEDIHKSFDFIHATNYFTFKDGLVTNLKAVESLLTRELKYQGSQYPLTSVIRMKKFIGRKWTMTAGEILKILFQIGDLDLHDPLVLEEQLIGVDIAYFSELINSLKASNKKLTSSYMNTLIDKAFDKFDDEF